MFPLSACCWAVLSVGLMTMREETQLPGGEPAAASAAAVDVGDG